MTLEYKHKCIVQGEITGHTLPVTPLLLCEQYSSLLPGLLLLPQIICLSWRSSHSSPCSLRRRQVTGRDSVHPANQQHDGDPWNMPYSGRTFFIRV